MRRMQWAAQAALAYGLFTMSPIYSYPREIVGWVWRLIEDLAK